MPGDEHNNSSSTTVTVSAPGKILLAGGYVVLEAPNVGVVLAVDKRFYSTVVREEISSSSENANAAKKPKLEKDESAVVTVYSPQFGATWKYQVARNISDDDSFLKLTADPSNASANPFVEKTLRVSLAYLCQSRSPKPLPLSSLEITILADNDFYSVTPHLEERNWDATPENLARLPKFLPCKLSSEGSLQKTGLGSSAALVTSLVGALVLSSLSTTSDATVRSSTNNIPGMDEALRRRIHNLAQICHCHAQGKVGSGFDVSSASYGSHVYQRFPKTLLSGLLQDLDTNSSTEQQESSALSEVMGAALQKLVEESSEEYKWTGGVQKALSWNTELLQIMLADVSGGSESPSMARKILNWKSSSDDISCWNNLLKHNQEVVDITDKISQELKTYDSPSIAKMAETLSKTKLNSKDNSDAPLFKSLCDLRKALLETRKNLKKMGDLAAVPVEPDEQTQLADATMNLPGVIASLVPGAGGYDALVVVYVNNRQVRDSICQLWTNYKVLKVCPLAVRFGHHGDGVRYEPVTPEYKLP